MSKNKQKVIKSNPENPYENRVGLVYARVSSMRQATEGSGLESQEGRCIKELINLKIPHEKTFPDSFTGKGDFMNRPSMKALLDYIDSHPQKRFIVVFDDLKRFARDLEFHLKLRRAFRARDVLLKCLNYNFDESPEGRFVENILAGSAELEREQNQRQVVQKQKARLEKGYWAFGSKKGYKQTPDPIHGTLSIPTHEGRGIIKYALESFANGTLSRKIDVCNYLVEKGLWSKQRPEKYLDRVTAMLTDSFYAGYVEYSKWDVVRRMGHHEGIISLEIFELIQKRLKNEGRIKNIRRDLTDDFEHRGLVVCDGCGEHLTASWAKSHNGNKYPYYLCQKKGCEFYKKSIKRKDIEDKFNKLLEETYLKAEVDKIVSRVFDKVWNEEVGDLKLQENTTVKRINELEEKISGLSEVASKAKSEQVRDAYEKQIEKAMDELNELQSQTDIGKLDLSIPYQTALGKVTGLLKSPYIIWQKLGMKERHELFYFIFEAKLPYNLKTGYQTSKIRSYASLFEQFTTQNTMDVEMLGIEPRCR